MFPDLMRDDVFRLETERLWLRWPRAADAARIAELAGEREVAEMTAQIPHPYPPGAAAEFVLLSRASNHVGARATFVLTLKHRPNEMLGVVGLSEVRTGEAVIGYWLGKAYWGQGLMTEAVCSLIGLIVQTTDIETICANARTGNIASRRVLEKVGFTSAGFGVEAAPSRGGSVPVERFILTRASWTGCSAPARRERELARAN